MSTKLSPNLDLSTMIKSDKAILLGIDNTPKSEEIIDNLRLLAENVYEKLFLKFGHNIIVNSGYRCPELNKAVRNSSSKSQHMVGQAMDIEIPGISNYDLAKWVSENLDFDQLILENYVLGNPDSGWVHISYKGSDNRKQIKTKKKDVDKLLDGLPAH
ncbi:MAG: DUF882 domain-containing protein [Nitrospirae bacterium]|nr:DUF882 domain-containing protein [Nitrospirota bacterium]